MLLNLIVSLVRIKLESNNFKLCSGNMLNFYFQKQYYRLLSLNNVHVGAKLNRDQTINKTIQNTMKMLLKNRKNIENHHCGGGPKANSARGLFSLLLLGPEPDSQQPGRRKGPPRRRPHGPHGPRAGPRCQGAILAVD